MEIPKTSGEIEIHGIVYKGTLPETFHYETEDVLRYMKRDYGGRWRISMIIY
jgi:hypothetical protein